MIAEVRTQAEENSDVVQGGLDRRLLLLKDGTEQKKFIAKKTVKVSQNTEIS